VTLNAKEISYGLSFGVSEDQEMREGPRDILLSTLFSPKESAM